MKILVDEKPLKPKKCLFSKRNVEYGYICKLGHHLLLCKDTRDCEYLEVRKKEAYTTQWNY